nr:hypothetical protein [Ignavibacteria bacterium]
MQITKNIKLTKDRYMKLTILILFILFSVNSYSQGKKKLSPSKQPAAVKNITGGLTETLKADLSDEELKLNEKIDLLRRTGDVNSVSKMNELRVNSNTISKNSVTMNSEFNSGNSDFKKVSNRITDNVTRADVFSGNYLVASAVQVEQTGATAGKIWLIIAVAQADTGVTSSGDSLLLFNSIDNGETFSLISSIQGSTANKINRDELDMEIIESSAGTKYIYVTVGYTSGGYSGNKKITILTFDDAGNFNENVLSIPGYSTSSDYYKPRITSDNSTYPAQAYVYVAFMQDSIDGITHNIMSKTLKVYNPYSLFPTITYFPQSIYSPIASLSNEFKTQTDIA